MRTLLSISLSAGLLAPLAAQAQEAPAKPAAPTDAAELAKIQAKRTGTIRSLRQIGLALFEFDTEFGDFPNKETAKDVKEATGTEFTLAGESSNAYFRQLIAVGIVKDERTFQAGNPINPADQKFATEAQALALGECEFSYFPGASSSSHPGRPLVVIPLIHGEMKFDPKPFGGNAVILRTDNSVTIHPINEKGEVMLDGKDLFDPTQEYWEGKKVQVAWPK